MTSDGKETIHIPDIDWSAPSPVPLSYVRHGFGFWQPDWPLVTRDMIRVRLDEIQAIAEGRP